MPELESQIIEILRANDGGMMAKDIARLIGNGVTKRDINPVLYRSDAFVRGDGYLWYLATEAVDPAERVKNDPVIRSLNLPKKLKKYSVDDFEALAPWGDLIAGHTEDLNPNCLVTVPVNGRRIYCDSSYEVKALHYLLDNNLCLDVGAQIIDIGYEGAFGNQHSYYPDLFVLLADNTVAVLEIKPARAMAQHTNMEKYASLAAYCETMGFRYSMLDPSLKFMTCEDLADRDVNPDLYDDIVEYMSGEELILFDNEDVREWFEEYGDGTVEAFNLDICSIIINENWFNKFDYGFRVYNRPCMENETER